MRRTANAVLGAFGYFSTLPLGSSASRTLPDGSAILVLPLVGAIIGLASGAAARLSASFAPSPWPALVAFALVIALSGAIHVDGFLDACDALCASVPPARRLEILEDPHHGTYALVGMALAAAFWIAALGQLAPGRLVPALVTTETLARLSVVPLWSFPHARRLAARRLTLGPALTTALLAAALGLALSRLVTAPAALGIVLGPFALAAALAAWSARQLGGGLTGDVYGAIVVVNEIAILIALGAAPWR